MCGHDWARMPFAAAAGTYASMGLAVLPLEAGGKRPHKMLGDRGGVHWATADAGQVRRWWDLDPAANIGIACGASGLAVLDLDVKHGNNGEVALGEWLRSWGGQLPWPAPAAETPSGGMHLWYAAQGVPGRQGILPGVDLKAAGGYVAAAPSSVWVTAGGHDGERSGEVLVSYRWGGGSCPCQPVAAPGWLALWARDAASAGSPANSHGQLPDPDGLTVSGIPRGERNSMMHRVACSLFRKFGTTPAGVAEVTGSLRVIWDHTDQRDYPWDEVLVSIDSARRFIDRRRAAEDADAASAASWLRRHG